MTVRESARKALKWFQGGKRWHQGSAFRWGNNSTPEAACLFGVTKVACRVLSLEAGYRLRGAICRKSGIGTRGGLSFGDWNDHPDRTFKDVERLLRSIAYGRPYRP